MVKKSGQGNKSNAFHKSREKSKKVERKKKGWQQERKRMAKKEKKVKSIGFLSFPVAARIFDHKYNT